MDKFFHRGHAVNVIPDHDPEGGVWLARVAVDIKTKEGTERVYYTDHLHAYRDEVEAREAAAAFGRHVIDTFIVPSMGEGPAPEQG